jgi:hypothetical protein
VPVSAPAPDYSERLTPPVALWVGIWVGSLALGLSFYVALGPAFGLLALLVPGVLLTALLVRTTATVAVTGGELVAGRAHIPVSALGPARALSAEESRVVRGPGSDPAGYHLIRGWVPEGVRAEVVDPGDPTPYWFVATRHPQELAAAIEAAR